jgi:hypothetical protein
VSTNGNVIVSTKLWDFTHFYNIYSHESKKLKIDGEKVYAVVGGGHRGFFDKGKYFSAYKDGKVGLVDENLSIVIPFEYQTILPKRKNNFIAKLHGKYGVIDINNNKIVPFHYDGIDFTGHHPYFHVTQKLKEGLVDDKGKELLPCVYDIIYTTSLSNRFIVGSKGKSGLVDSNNKVIIAIVYDYIKYDFKKKKFLGGFLRKKGDWYDIHGNILKKERK